MKRSILLAATTISLVQAINSTDDWITVDKTDIYNNLATCAQPCVRDVNQLIDMGHAHCQNYGCVCSESTQGQNYLWGLSNVTACAEGACSDSEDARDAEMAYQDLCLVYATSSSRPNRTSDAKIMRIESGGYAELSECAKFALNGCLNENGTRDEANCGPIRKWDHWEDYHGVAAQRECSTADCLCKEKKFDASFAVAYDAGERFCGMWVSTQALPNEEYENMQNVLATFCASEGFPPKDWFLNVVGLPPGTNGSSANSSTVNRDDDWTLSNRLQLGIGAGIGIPALVVTAFGVYVAWNQLRFVRRAP